MLESIFGLKYLIWYNVIRSMCKQFYTKDTNQLKLINYHTIEKSYVLLFHVYKFENQKQWFSNMGELHDA